ncbi:MAG: hypothetical protein ACK57T_00600 [Dolichospermum sp.]
MIFDSLRGVAIQDSVGINSVFLPVFPVPCSLFPVPCSLSSQTTFSASPIYQTLQNLL